MDREAVERCLFQLDAAYAALTEAVHNTTAVTAAATPPPELARQRDDLLMLRGMLKARLGMYVDAQRDLEIAHLRRPLNADTLYALAAVLWVLHRTEDAMAHVERALLLIPGHPELLRMWAHMQHASTAFEPEARRLATVGWRFSRKGW